MRSLPWKEFFVKHYHWIFAFLVALEVSLFTFWRRELGIYAGPIVLLILAMLIFLYPTWKTVFFPQASSSAFYIDFPSKTGIIWGVYTGFAFVLTLLYIQILEEYPVILERTDIYPTIEVCVQRFLNGEDVYAFIPQFGYDHYPNYLPGKWMPFVLAEWGGFDYRWIPFGICLAGLLFYHQNLISKQLPVPIQIFLLFAPWLILLYYFLHIPWHLAHTVELMDLGLHLILFTAILKGGILFRAGSLVWVLLSRYSIIFWVPVFIVSAFFTEGKRKTLITAILVAGGILVWYVIPFLSRDWHSFSLGHEAYLDAAMAAWTTTSHIGTRQIVPHVMQDQVGIASYFYLFSSGDMITRINKLRMVHLLVSIFTPLILGIIFLKIRHRVWARYYYLFGLKAYLMFFYVFIQVPFLYLFITPLFLSLVLLQEADYGKKIITGM